MENYISLKQMVDVSDDELSRVTMRPRFAVILKQHSWM